MASRSYKQFANTGEFELYKGRFVVVPGSVEDKRQANGSKYATFQIAPANAVKNWKDTHPDQPLKDAFGPNGDLSRMINKVQSFNDSEIKMIKACANSEQPVDYTLLPKCIISRSTDERFAGKKTVVYQLGHPNTSHILRSYSRQLPSNKADSEDIVNVFRNEAGISGTVSPLDIKRSPKGNHSFAINARGFRVWINVTDADIQKNRELQRLFSHAITSEEQKKGVPNEKLRHVGVSTIVPIMFQRARMDSETGEVKKNANGDVEIYDVYAHSVESPRAFRVTYEPGMADTQDLTEVDIKDVNPQWEEAVDMETGEVLPPSGDENEEAAQAPSM